MKSIIDWYWFLSKIEVLWSKIEVLLFKIAKIYVNGSKHIQYHLVIIASNCVE